MDDEMIKRVIKASFECWAEDKGSSTTMDDLDGEEKEFAIRHAKAVIKAMREPTEKMLAAGAFIDTAQSGVYGSEDVWKAMIDAVIND